MCWLGNIHVAVYKQCAYIYVHTYIHTYMYTVLLSMHIPKHNLRDKRSNLLLQMDLRFSS